MSIGQVCWTRAGYRVEVTAKGRDKGVPVVRVLYSHGEVRILPVSALVVRETR